MASDRPFSILFVCLGNICRSPLAEGVMRHKIGATGLESRFSLDSCGTGPWHVGNPPDRRSIAIARSHGIDLTDQRARKLRRNDFIDFDLILAMDRSNLSDLKAMRPDSSVSEVALYLDYCGLSDALGFDEVPDPYFGGSDGFEAAYQMISKASDILLSRHS